MTPWLSDPDVRLYHGDALQVLRGLPDGSVDCCVTSPPYWGLRDYGTGEWAGGDPDCDHKQRETRSPHERKSSTLGGGTDTIRVQEEATANYRDVCGKCSATRVDQQLGLEPTPDLFVQNMVAVFREVSRVLADHGTCWVNLGDSYAGGAGGRGDVGREIPRPDGSTGAPSAKHDGKRIANAVPLGLKPKDLVGIPWRVAFALQADGWYLRSDIVWAKPNPMPESVTDRPTKSHEYVFLLTKRPRYFFDQEAVREPALPESYNSERPPTTGAKIKEAYGYNGIARTTPQGRTCGVHPAGRNVRSVWQIATQPYPEAHFATFPEELARRCIVAGCPSRVCRVCGKPSERIVETEYRQHPRNPNPIGRRDGSEAGEGYRPSENKLRDVTTVGWSDCGHNDWRPGVVLDPFMGSGTVAKVARDHQRHAIGIDLNEQYLELAARRLQQLSLLTGTA